MFETIKPYSSYSIKDAAASKAFYANVLGLNVSEEPMKEGDRFLTLNLEGGSKVLLYPKPDHVPASFTVLNLPVKEIHEAVKDLKGRGVKFEHYDGNDAEEINHHCGPSIAWFKDPSGNFLALQEIKNEFRMQTCFAVTPEKLFGYFTDIKLLEKWCYPDGMSLHIPQFEAVVNGRYRYEHSGRQGTWVAKGVIKEFIPNQRIVQVDETVCDPSGKIIYQNLESILEFKDYEGGSELVIIQGGFTDQEGGELCKIGWEQCLKRLEDLLKI